MIQALPNAMDIWANPGAMLDEWAHSEQKVRHEQLIAEWVGQGGKVVELGCGNGRFSLALDYTFYTGYDQSPAMLDAAKALNPKIDIALVDIFKFSSDESYDTLLMIDVAIHQNMPLEAILQVIGNWYSKRYIVTLLAGDTHEDLLNSTVIPYADLMRLYKLPDMYPNRMYFERLQPEDFSWVLVELIRE